MSLHHRRPAPETSMLLASDGSTTRLLEALTGQRLVVLSARWPGQRRTLLEAGQTQWETDGGGRPCASKSYVIDNVGSGNVLFLEERFNPDIVPPAGLPPLPPHAPYFQAAAS